MGVSFSRVQCAAVGATIAFTPCVTGVLLKIIGATMGITSNEQHQSECLDLVEHEEKGYHELA